jgi:hypothetical protein
MKMSSGLLQKVNEGESSVKAVDIPFSNTSQIVEGGCYHFSPLPEPRPPNFKSPPNLKPAPRRWIVVAVIALIVIIAFALGRYFSRR